MAKKDFSLTFKNCYISLEDNTITEIGKDYNEVFVLSEVLKELEGKSLNISFKESVEYSTTDHEVE